ncbi:MATE family efflux transporter [Clostridium sp.]|uniref:MATE family efflux transporter n=1 Tax=Clostridium sp. TaxID=1506 RepID=UPI0026226E4D|nr:MATE family efflux transporter [Clostridium sp.]
MKTNQLETEPIGKLLLKYSIPAMIGMLVTALYNVVDRMFIGHIPNVGSLAITGVGVTMPISTIILAFAMLIGVGATAQISIKLGQGKKDEAAKVVGNAITLGVIVSLIITVLGLIFSNSILYKFGASEGTLPYAKTYIDIILIGTIFNIIGFIMSNTIRGDGSPKLSATIMVIGCLTNIVLDWLFIFGLGLGIKGAAIATSISQMLTAIIGLSYYIRGKSNIGFKKENLKIDKKIMIAIVSIGVAPFSMQIAASLIQVISNNSLKTYGGDLAIGAMTTISSVALMCLMPIFGLNQGAQPIIGYNYGANKIERYKRAYLLSLKVATIILTVAFVIVQVFPTVIIGFFNKDPELMNISIRGIRIYLLTLPIIGIAITGSNFMQSIGRAKESMLISLLRQVILLIPLILILPRFLELDGIWIAQPISDIIAASVTAILLVKQFKEVEKEEQGKEEERNILIKEAN